MLYRSLGRFLMAAKAVASGRAVVGGQRSHRPAGAVVDGIRWHSAAICAGVASTRILADSTLAPFQFLECPVNKRQGTPCHFGFCRIV